MGKLEFDPEAVAIKPLKKSLTVADRRQIEMEVPKKMTRAEAKEKKELEEARRDGTAMPETDEKGDMINPHIPNYIASVPWYIDKDKKPSLFHQHKLKADVKHKIGDWYHRGVPKDGKSANRYRKGACENCGAMTHKRRDCMERPRKKGAKWTGDDIAPDEFMQPELDLGFEGKRDRWNGYDPARHRFEVFEEFTKVDIARKAINAQRLQDEIESGQIDNPDLTDIVNGDKYEDGEVSMGGQSDSKQTVSVRNLRIREDTAKYLRNLDPESAYYDPKTRSMRENPYELSGKKEEDVPFAGENFVRHTGESQEFAKSQVFAWDAMDKGVDVHPQANPTQLAVLRKSYKVKKAAHTEVLKTNVIDKYGGMDHLKAPPKELLLAQTENYVEYSRTGQVIKGQEKAKVKSRYEEDVLIGNHSSVWGSYWEGGRWGFACCRSLVKKSYCVKLKIQTQSEASSLVPQVLKTEIRDDSGDENEPSSEDEDEGLSLMQIHKKKTEKDPVVDVSKLSKKELKKHEKSERKRVRKEAKVERLKKEKELQDAIQKEDERVKQVDEMLSIDERKRKYNSMHAVNEPSEAELEAWKRKKVNTSDPMGFFLSK